MNKHTRSFPLFLKALGLSALLTSACSQKAETVLVESSVDSLEAKPMMPASTATKSENKVPDGNARVAATDDSKSQARAQPKKVEARVLGSVGGEGSAGAVSDVFKSAQGTEAISGRTRSGGAGLAGRGTLKKTLAAKSRKQRAQKVRAEPVPMHRQAMDKDLEAEKPRAERFVDAGVNPMTL